MKQNIAGIKTKTKQTRNANIFYWTMFALPLLQFIVFYIIVNAGSIYLAFFKYDSLLNKYFIEKGHVWDNFKDFFLTTPKEMLGNSLSIVVISLLINVVICLFFSYYLYKKFRFSKFYKVILFLPSIISGTVLAIFFMRFTDNCLVKLDWFPIHKELSRGGLPENYPLLILFTFFTGFGPTVLVYSNAMSQIPDSLIEASELDGASQIRQFFSVIIPHVWPTIVSYITISIVAFSANQLSLYTFFPGGKYVDPAIQNYAYHLFHTMVDGRKSSVCTVAASGVLLTLVVAPVSIILNKLLTKFGPSEK